MPNYSLSVSQDQLETLLSVYKSHEKENNNQYILFQASKDGVTIQGYKSGKVVLHGEYINELEHIKVLLGLETYEAIGSDEVGTGDLFGPIVVCSAYASIDDIKYLESLGIKDSKSLSDKQIIKLGPILAKKLIHSILILTPEKYNELIRKGFNMNKIKAYLHNQAIIKTIEKVPENIPVIVDQFCEPSVYFNYLKGEKNVFKKLEFYTKAESVHLSVAAASIIARYAFLAKMQQYSKFIGIRLLKGAGAEVDKQLVDIYRSRGYKTLRPITKLNFKNLVKNNVLPPSRLS